MPFYQKITRLGFKYLGKAKTFKWGFNLSPMYRRSTAKITSVSDDLMKVKIKLPLNYKNGNFVGTMFGGSMFSALDPIPMVQLMIILGKDYIVWDKSAEIFFKSPGKETLIATFEFSVEEIIDIKNRVKTDYEVEIIKTTQLVNQSDSKLVCEVRKPYTLLIKNSSKTNENLEI